MNDRSRDKYASTPDNLAVTGRRRDEPSVHTEEAESLSCMFLRLLERLSPAERTVFLLHDVFGRSHAEVAGIVGANDQACGQLLQRSREVLGAAKGSIEAARRRREDVAALFFAGVNRADIPSVTESLAPDAVACLDGDIDPDAPPEPIVGRRAVASSLGVLSQKLRQAGITVQLDRLGHRPRAFLHNREGRLVGAISLEIADGLVQTIRSATDPGALR